MTKAKADVDDSDNDNECEEESEMNQCKKPSNAKEIDVIVKLIGVANVTLDDLNDSLCDKNDDNIRFRRLTRYNNDMSLDILLVQITSLESLEKVNDGKSHFILSRPLF